MSHNELKQLRRLLFLDVGEAAKYIGNCEPRTWQRWEKGDRTIPEDVIDKISMLAISHTERLSNKHDESSPECSYFVTFEQYKSAGGAGTVLDWRLAQSLSAHILSERLRTHLRRRTE